MLQCQDYLGGVESHERDRKSLELLQSADQVATFGVLNIHGDEARILCDRVKLDDEWVVKVSAKLDLVEEVRVNLCLENFIF